MIEFDDIVGFAGIFLIVTAYLLLQTKRLPSDGLAYSVLNAIGALCIIFTLAFEFNLSAFVMEVVWVAVSGIGIINYFRRSPEEASGD